MKAQLQRLPFRERADLMGTINKRAKEKRKAARPQPGTGAQGTSSVPGVPERAAGSGWLARIGAIMLGVVGLIFLLYGLTGGGAQGLVMGVSVLALALLAGVDRLRRKVPLISSADTSKATAGWVLLVLLTFSAILAAPSPPRSTPVVASPGPAAAPTPTVRPVAAATVAPAPTAKPQASSDPGDYMIADDELAALGFQRSVIAPGSEMNMDPGSEDHQYINTPAGQVLLVSVFVQDNDKDAAVAFDAMVRKLRADGQGWLPGDRIDETAQPNEQVGIAKVDDGTDARLTMLRRVGRIIAVSGLAGPAGMSVAPLVVVDQAFTAKARG